MNTITELSNKLIKGFEWMNTHPEDVESNLALMQRAVPIFQELDKLGVDQQTCWNALLLGLPIKEVSQ